MPFRADEIVPPYFGGQLGWSKGGEKFRGRIMHLQLLDTGELKFWLAGVVHWHQIINAWVVHVDGMATRQLKPAEYLYTKRTKRKKIVLRRSGETVKILPRGHRDCVDMDRIQGLSTSMVLVPFDLQDAISVAGQLHRERRGLPLVFSWASVAPVTW